MQRFSNQNVFTSRSNRFSETGPTFRSNNIKDIKIGVGFESKNDKDNYFTNFLNSDKQDNYLKMCKLYNQISNNDSSFINKEYVCDEIYDNGRVVDRLISIINYESGLRLTKNDISHIFKLKSKDNKKVHIYINLNSEIAELILVDLYHLSMPADVWSNKRLVKRGSLEETRKAYSKFELCKFNLNNVLN